MVLFREDSYYGHFKSIRNRFRQFRSLDLIGKCLDYIHAPTRSRIESLQKHPWLVLVLMKWIFLDDNYPNSRGKTANKKDLMLLLQMTLDLTNKLRSPSDYDHHTLFLRNLAYQQFPYQSSFNYAHLARQVILFSNLPNNHLINKQFTILTGLKIADFLGLSWVLAIHFHDDSQQTLTLDWFNQFKDKYSKDTVTKYLNVISSHIDEINKDLVSADIRARKSTELYESSPFIKRPLIHTGSGYVLTERHLLYRCVEHYVYDILRQWDSQAFMAKFGGMFERYTEEILKEGALTYSTEKQVETALGLKGKQIDFIVHEESSNIFIDAKGVELNYKGRVTHTASFLKGNTKTSIIKAISQAHDVVRKLNKNPNCGIPNHICNYLLVVTYKEFHLGSGRNYYDIVAKDAMDKIYEKYSDTPSISPDNMYFITIEEFELACEMTKHPETSLTTIIEAAKHMDNDPKTRKFGFIQHLHSMETPIKKPAKLRAIKDQTFSSLQESIVQT